MTHRVCYIVDKKVDNYISSAFQWNSAMGKRGMSPSTIASLRGLYDTNAAEVAEQTGKEPEYLLPNRALDPSNAEDKAILDEAVKKLMTFRTTIKMRTAARMANATKHVDRSYDALRHAWSLSERRGRVNLLSSLFSSEVDRLMENNSIDRQAFVNGFKTVDGQYIGGELSILESVYNQVLGLRQNYYEMLSNPEESFKNAQANRVLDWYGAPETAEEYRQLNEHRYNEYTKILENWNSLIPFVLKDLVQKEGVKMGIKKEYAVAASSDSFGENDIAAKWDISESKRDGWQENSDLQSAFGSVGQQVRRILATVPMMQAVPNIVNGKFIGYKYERVVDDLGNQRFMDPVKTHQALVEFLKGIQDSNDMINKMSRNGEPGTAKVGWMQPILDVLTSNSQARTQFFVDFKKNFQPYSIMFEDEEESFGKVRKIKTRVLNRLKNLLKGRYEILLTSRNSEVKGLEKIRVFDGKGNINWQRLADLRKTVLAWTNENISQRQTIAGQKIYAVGTSPLLNNGKNATITLDGKQQRITYDMRRDFLMDTFSSLGFDVSMDTVDSILNSRDIYAVREQLEQLFDRDGNTGIVYALDGNDRTNFKALAKDDTDARNKALEALGKMANGRPMRFKSLYKKSKTTGDNRKVYPVEEHIDKLLNIISNHQESQRVESRVRYNGNTMYSFVAPSYLGDRLEQMQSYVDNDDKQGLLKHLQSEYLNSMYFVDDEYIATNGEKGKILNSWLKAIVDACNDRNTPLAQSVAAIFTYERDLGTDEKKFEDFTSKEHAIDMFVHFFADAEQNRGYGGRGSKNINKKASAMYPVFILGDAGVSKYIRAPRISTPTRVDKNGNVLDEADANKTHHIEYRFDSAAQEEVLDNFWNIYLQEKRRMGMEEAMTYDMYANGKKVKRNKGEYSILTFLNENSDEYNDKYKIPEGSEFDETVVKNIIRTYLDDMALNGIEHDENGRKVITPSFKQRLKNLGVLETTDARKGKKFNYIDSIANQNNLDDKIREFYWNTKLATANQLQLMTIDPSFYHGTKDLQKRYKEIHAPGSVLDTEALDFNGRRYSDDGIERVVYFNDISLNAENTNPEFMETVLRVFGKASETEINSAIENGILEPKEDSRKETERQNRLIDLLGDNYEIYKAYTKNTLTDGQGYRTLKSYRKVMGMAGKWTQNMENAYNEIMAIRERHADGSDVTAEEMQDIASFALVLQPIKPYMFTHEKYKMKVAKKVNGQTVTDAQGNPVMVDTEMLIPVQHKYAEALIIPELMPKGSKLRDLGLWMDKNNVDMVGSTKIAKVGCFGQASIDKVTTSDELDGEMSKAYVHELPYRDYRIQTNVPEHINASQLFGTQVRKLIMAGLTMDADYSSYIGRNEINLSTSDDENDANKHARLVGRNLLALYNSLICANIFDSYEKFANNAKDIEKLSELLQQSTVGSMREAMDNLFSYVVTGNEEGLQKFFMPLFEGGLEHDSAAMILSTFKKIVNKQQISGGSAVQVSAFGINGYQEDGGLRYVQDPDNKANILYAEIEMPFDRVFSVDVKNADGSVSKQKVNLKYDKYCNLDGTLIPTGEALEKGTKEWKKYQSYTYKEVDGKLVSCDYRDPEAKVYKPLIEQEYPDILSILAYRIPTENDYSMINCRIKRFTSKMAGGTLKVPPQGTTIAGFDFDIDKLYFMQREYHKTFTSSAYTESHFSDSDKYQIWGSFYEDNPEVRSALEDAQHEAEMKNPSLVQHIIRRGVDTGRVRHLTPLNSYWDAAGITDRFNITKQEAFAKSAQESGIKPTQNLVKGEVTEKMDTYDFDKSPEENSRASRNNLLIDLIQARLMDPQTARQRYTPGGFENAHKAARLMRELDHGDLNGVTTESNGVITSINLSKLSDRQDDDTDPEPNYDPTDPYTILVYNQQNQVAGKLIGIFANESTNHAFASSVDVFELNEPIQFCGHYNYKDFLHKDDPDMAWQASHNVAEFLAASVDAVKDPVLNFMNLNTITADAGAVLARIGYNMTEIGLFLKQPIIMKACEDSFNSGKNINTVIDDIRRDLKSHLTGVNTDEKVDLTADVLALGIVNDRKMREEGKTTDDFLAENAKTQMAVLNLFSNVLKASQDVLDFVLNTKFTASNAVSSTFGGMYAQQLKVQRYLDKFPKSDKDKGSLSYKMVVAKGLQETGMFSTPIEDDNKNLTMKKKEYLRHVRFNPFAYEQAMYDANRKAIKLLAKYYPYETDLYKGVRGRMQELARFGSLSEDDINEIHSNLPVALLAKQTKSMFNGEAVHKKDGNELPYTNRQYYREKFAEDLMSQIAQDPNLAKLKIFEYLTPTSEIVEAGKDKRGLPITKEVWRIDMQDVGGLDADTKEEIRESWAYLMEVDDQGYFKNEDYAELGRDLFMYCFYQLGFDFSPFSFMHLAPTAVKDHILVERENSLPLNSFTTINAGTREKPSDDVLVWSSSVTGSMEKAEDFNVDDRNAEGELIGNAYRLPDIITLNDVRNLIHEAKSHPELTFKIDRDLAQDEFNLFSNRECGEDVPSNIQFSQGTLQSVSEDSKQAVSYGRSRTYRQFLNEILEGKENSISSDDYARQFILNHLDNSRFVANIYNDGKRLWNIISKQTGITGTNYKERFTLDLSNYLSKADKDAISPIVKFNTDAKGQIIKATWAPCIKIGTSYYMPVGGEQNFNENSSPVMQFEKVEPWGTSKTITYDNNKKLSPCMMYKSDFYAEAKVAKTDNNVKASPDSGVSPEPNEPSNGGGNTEDIRQNLENAFFTDFVQAIIRKNGSKDAEDIAGLKDTVSKASTEDLQDTVNALKQACRDNGVLMLDKDGNPMMGC